ncbi:MAG: hypothetical protein ACREOQ_14300 [Gemmatimonadales bacterium]
MLVGRYASDLVQRALDMLFVQCFKAHVSTYQLATLAQVEDAATIIRRSLELAVQAVYIGRESSEKERRKRAGRFLAFLWVKWPAQLRKAIPADERQAWDAVLQTYGAGFTPARPRWGPTFADIFADLEEADTAAGTPRSSYRDDYSYLSNIAHGTPPTLVHSYAQPVMPLHDARLVPRLLAIGSMYTLACAMIWNEAYQLIDDARLAALGGRAIMLARTSRAPAGGSTDQGTGS